MSESNEDTPASLGTATRVGLPDIKPHDRLFHAVMSLRTEHGDHIDQNDAMELYDAIVGLMETMR